MIILGLCHWLPFSLIAFIEFFTEYLLFGQQGKPLDFLAWDHLWNFLMTVKVAFPFVSEELANP